MSKLLKIMISIFMTFTLCVQYEIPVYGQEDTDTTESSSPEDTSQEIENETEQALSQEENEPEQDTSQETEADEDVQESSQSQEDTADEILDVSSMMPDNDTLFEEYVQEKMYEEQGIVDDSSISMPALYSIADLQLTGVKASVFSTFKSNVENIANGNVEYTDSIQLVSSQNPITIDLSELNYNYNSSYSSTACFVYELFDYLIADEPYSLYWFDKVEGLVISKSAKESNGVLTINSLSVKMCVSADYSYDGTTKTYHMNFEKAASTTTAVKNAKAIVDEASTYSDYDKLKYYFDKIRSLTSYNSDAGSTSYDGNYGDPWQLIYVFDMDDTTNVVCEGYAKAFEYLCDLSEFSNGNINCVTVWGTIKFNSYNNGSGHMWNIVTMDDYQNYLVDVTNGVFLKGAAGSIDTKYVINDKNWTYTYDSTIISLFQNYLELASNNYVSGKESTAVESISLNVSNYSTVVGADSETLSVTLAPDNATNTKVTWTSSNTSVAKVNSNGEVTPVDAGTAVITASTSNNQKVTCVVTVKYVIYYYDDVDGTKTSYITYNKGNTASIQTNTYLGIYKDGYTFLGWYDADDTEYATGSKVTMLKNIDLYPHWQANTYTVNFDSNGGEGTMQVIECTYDTEQCLPINVFSKEGCRFIGWNTKEDGSGTSYTNQESIKNLATSGETTLYAMWEESEDSLDIDFDSIVLDVNESAQIKASSTIESDTLNWISSDDSIVKVEDGKVTGISEGSATIIVATESGFVRSCEVTVQHAWDDGTITKEPTCVDKGTKLYTCTKCGATSTEEIPCLEAEFTTKYKVSYTTHVQNVGWQNNKYDGELSGTEGQSLRLEGIKIKLGDITNCSGSIQYKTHIQNIGWESTWKENGEMSGTSGQSLRLEAIQIQLTGEISQLYDVYYRVHAQNFGWLDWAKNGQKAGTSGYSYRLEAIEIILVKKDGGSAPGATTQPYVDVDGKKDTNYLQYQTHVQNIGWQSLKYDGVMSGTSGQSLRLEGIKISRANGLDGISGSIEYRTHIENIGWESTWKKDGEMSGTSGKSLRLEAIQIQLTDDLADQYDIYYRVHAQNFGWLDWAKNGEMAGTAGYSYRLEAIQIVLVEKDGTPPGSTTRPYVGK